MEEDAEFAGKVVFLNEIEGMWFCEWESSEKKWKKTQNDIKICQRMC